MDSVIAPCAQDAIAVQAVATMLDFGCWYDCHSSCASFAGVLTPSDAKFAWSRQGNGQLNKNQSGPPDQAQSTCSSFTQLLSDPLSKCMSCLLMFHCHKTIQRPTCLASMVNHALVTHITAGVELSLKDMLLCSWVTSIMSGASVINMLLSWQTISMIPMLTSTDTLCGAVGFCPSNSRTCGVHTVLCRAATMQVTSYSK